MFNREKMMSCGGNSDVLCFTLLDTGVVHTFSLLSFEKEGISFVESDLIQQCNGLTITAILALLNHTTPTSDVDTRVRESMMEGFQHLLAGDSPRCRSITEGKKEAGESMKIVVYYEDAAACGSCESGCSCSH